MVLLNLAVDQGIALGVQVRFELTAPVIIDVLFLNLSDLEVMTSLVELLVESRPEQLNPVSESKQVWVVN